MDLASYYLFAEGVTFDAIREVLRELKTGEEPKYEESEPFVIQDDEFGELKGVVFTRQEPRSAPKWYSLIRQLTGVEWQDRLGSSSHSGIVILRCHERLWGLSFGHSFRDVEERPLEYRFGRIAISNAIEDTDALRGFVSQTFGRNAKIRIETTTSDGPMDRLSFLDQSNRLRKLRARLEFEDENVIVEGGVGFRFPRASSVEQLFSILIQMKAWWNLGTETRDEIAEKDPVIEVIEPGRIRAYDADYEAALQNGPDDGFFLSFDLDELWTATDYHLKIDRTQVARLSLPDTDIVVQQVRAFLLGETDRNKLRIEFTLPNGTATREARSVICYERPQQVDEPFIVVRDEGKWWEYRSSWVRRIEERFERCLQQSESVSSQFMGQLGTYNQREYVTNDPEGEWLNQQPMRIQGACVLHRISLIRIDGARSPVELADLYLPNQTLLSVKRGTDLKRIDEVASQAEAAARMLVREPEYSQRATALLSELGCTFSLTDRRSIRIGCVTIANEPKLSTRAKERIALFFQRVGSDFNFEPVWLFVNASPQ